MTNQNSPKVGIIIQARMGSTRLPGKILKPFHENHSILDIILDKFHEIKGAKVIVATSTNEENDALEEYLISRGENVFRGSENDVLERFIDAAEKYDVDSIIRICSDNPFLDSEGIQELVTTGPSINCDYLGFRINDKPSILTHFGFWGEYVTLDALKRVFKTTPTDSAAHEHVTNYIYTHPDDFDCKWFDCPKEIDGRTDIRLTVDTESDLENAKTVYSDLKQEGKPLTISNIVAYLDKHEDIKNSMLSNIVNNKK